jgi:hypothetical protein
MRIWITKWALTQGIIVVDADITDQGLAIVAGHWNYYHKKDYCTSEAAARGKFEEMKQRKIASLRKQLSRIKNLEFNAK